MAWVISCGSRLIWGCAKLLPPPGVEEAELWVTLSPGAEREDGMLWDAALLTPLLAFLGPVSGRSASACRNELSGFSLGQWILVCVYKLMLMLFQWFRTSEGWKPAPALLLHRKVCLLEPQVLLKHLPAMLAGVCAAGHGAGMKGLAKRSPAVGPPWGWQGAQSSEHGPDTSIAQAGCRLLLPAHTLPRPCAGTCWDPA